MVEKEMIYFNFRIIDMGNGSQVIDESVKTPIDALTPEMQVEYMEVNNQLAFMDRLERMDQRRAERQRKFVKNPLYRLACLCGIA